MSPGSVGAYLNEPQAHIWYMKTVISMVALAGDIAMIHVTEDYPFVGNKPFSSEVKRKVPEFQVRRKHGFQVDILKNESTEAAAVVRSLEESAVRAPTVFPPHPSELVGDTFFEIDAPLTPAVLADEDGLFVTEHDDDGPNKGQPIAKCFVRAKDMDVADRWYQITQKEREESLDRYMETHTPDWTYLVPQTPLPPPVVRHHLDLVLDQIPSIYQHTPKVMKLRRAVSVADQSPVYTHFAKHYLSAFEKKLTHGITHQNDLIRLLAKYDGILVGQLGYDACKNDPWFQAFF